MMNLFLTHITGKKLTIAIKITENCQLTVMQQLLHVMMKIDPASATPAWLAKLFCASLNLTACKVLKIVQISIFSQIIPQMSKTLPKKKKEI